MSCKIWYLNFLLRLHIREVLPLLFFKGVVQLDMCFRIFPLATETGT